MSDRPKESLNKLKARRDDLIRELWVVFRDISDYELTCISSEDLNLWGLVTAHRAVQGRLSHERKD